MQEGACSSVNEDPAGNELPLHPSVSSAQMVSLHRTTRVTSARPHAARCRRNPFVQPRDALRLGRRRRELTAPRRGEHLPPAPSSCCSDLSVSGLLDEGSRLFHRTSHRPYAAEPEPVPGRRCRESRAKQGIYYDTNKMFFTSTEG